MSVCHACESSVGCSESDMLAAGTATRERVIEQSAARTAIWDRMPLWFVVCEREVHARTMRLRSRCDDFRVVHCAYAGIAKAYASTRSLEVKEMMRSRELTIAEGIAGRPAGNILGSTWRPCYTCTQRTQDFRGECWSMTAWPSCRRWMALRRMKVRRGERVLLR